ncbi:MAG: hypothetical protein IJS71_07965 [Clostridia bacterium]|nr:hypothetical protein [Clostridia bacterium]
MPVQALAPNTTHSQTHTSTTRTKPLPLQSQVEIIVTHPYSPLRNRKFKLIERKECWGEDRLLCIDENGYFRRIPTYWTDYVPVSAFNEVSNGRAYITGEKMVELAQLLQNLVNNLSTE